jgi:basic membrane protein A
MPLTIAKLSLAAFAAVFLIGCSGDSSTTAASGVDSKPAAGGAKPANGIAKPSALKIGVVFDSGGKGDKSFNDSAWRGVERAEKELGIDPANVQSVESKSPKDFEGNLSTLADSGCNVVFAVGVGQDVALKVVAPKFPDVKFGLIDSEVPGDNVRSIKFKEEEGSFLAGYAAALASKTGKIGFVGGKKIPLIEKFEAGYEAGAKAANPNIVVLPVKYTESWDDTTLGKVMATSLFDSGADVVYHAAGRCGLGVINAAKDAEGKFAIGVDSNQDDEAPGKVLTSMVKHVDDSVFTMIKDVQDGTFKGNTIIYDLKSGFVGLTDFKNTKHKLGPDGLKKLDEAAAKIKDGTYKVPTTTAEVAEFLKTLKK